MTHADILALYLDVSRRMQNQLLPKRLLATFFFLAYTHAIGYLMNSRSSEQIFFSLIWDGVTVGIFYCLSAQFIGRGLMSKPKGTRYRQFWEQLKDVVTASYEQHGKFYLRLKNGRMIESPIRLVPANRVFPAVQHTKLPPLNCKHDLAKGKVSITNTSVGYDISYKFRPDGLVHYHHLGITQAEVVAWLMGAVYVLINERKDRLADPDGTLKTLAEWKDILQIHRIIPPEAPIEYLDICHVRCPDDPSQ